MQSGWAAASLPRQHKPALTSPAIDLSTRAAPPPGWIVFLCFGSAFAILLVVAGLSFRATQEAKESDRWVRQSHAVLDTIAQLLLAMSDVESKGRGYVLTGDDSFLVSGRAALARFTEQQIILRALVADNPDQQPKLATLDRNATEKIRAAQTIGELRRTAGLAAAVALAQSGHGQDMMQAFQDSARIVQETELRLLAARDAVDKQRLASAETVLLTGTILGLLITAAAWLLLQRDSSRHRRAATALRQSEENYRALIQGILDYGIVMLGPTGDVLSWNTGAERMTGCTYQEMVGQPFSRFFLDEEVGRATDILRLAAERGLLEVQGVRKRKDGTRFNVRATYTALLNPDGNLRGYSLISRDLTESTESETRYRGLLEAAPDAMVVVNQVGEIVLLNLQSEKQFGYRRDELLGQKVTDIIPDGFAERLVADGLRSEEDAQAQQIGTGIELIGRRKDGSAFPIELMLSPLRSADGVLVTAAIRDISVRREAEKHLAQMEGRYRGLLEAAPDAMVVVNQREEIVLLNLQAEKQFGYHRDELIGQAVTNIIPDGFAERLVADGLRSAEDALAQQIGMGIELIGRRKDGSAFPIELMLSPLKSAEETLVTAAIRDITTRKKAEAHLLLKVEELNRSNDELEQFANLASHDLQEPLRMVASYTQLLSRRYAGRLDADADTFIAFAVDGASRMQRLIQDLLAYSRVGSKGKDLLDTSSEDALGQALLNLRGAIEDSAAVVTHDPLPAVMADEMQLVQLFQNLVGNAIKYQSAGVPRVHVAARNADGNRWIFSVKDNGLGIDPQYFDRIFGMFQRLHKREEFAGTGIGLAICKKIVERHGGQISVESEPGLGATFTFALSGAGRKT
jgi:PAS domain S-box-containing protein